MGESYFPTKAATRTQSADGLLSAAPHIFNSSAYISKRALCSPHYLYICRRTKTPAIADTAHLDSGGTCQGAVP